MTYIVEQQEKGLQASGTAGVAQWMETEVRMGGVELPGGLGHHIVYRGEGDYRVST